MRACDDEQGSSSPVRHECNEQGHGARAQGSSPALCRGPRAMDEWAWAKGKPWQSRVGSKRAAPQRALPRARARSLARSERKLACHERCAQRWSRAIARAQRAMARVHRAQERAQQALASAHSERWLACVERWRACSEHHLCDGLRWKMQQLCDERMGCAHMASDGCVRVAHGRALCGVVALRLDRFEILIWNFQFT